MKKKKELWLLIIVMILVLLVSACGGATPTLEKPEEEATTPPEPVTLTYWTPSPEEPYHSATTTMVNEFMEEYPWITVEVDEFGWGEYAQKIDTSVAAGSAPDVFWMDYNRLPVFVYYETLRPLDEFLPANYTDDFFPLAIQEVSHNGKIWGVRLDFFSEAILYNKDIIDAAGLEPPKTYEDAWSFDEFHAALEKVTKRVGDTTEVWGFVSNYGYNIYPIQPWLYAQGATFMDAEKTTYMGYTNSDDMVSALTWYTNLMKDGFAPIELIPDIFPAGKVAFMQAVPTAFYYLKEAYPDLNIGVMPFPCDERCAVNTGGYSLSISSQSEHPQEAWILIDFLTNQEGMKEWCELTGNSPPRKSAMEELPEFSEYPLNLFNMGVISGYGVIRPSTIAWPVFFAEFNSAVVNVITGADPKVELDRVAQMTEEELSKYK
jgi:fructooligosaccharide transport system substrate-binding protein